VTGFYLILVSYDHEDSLTGPSLGIPAVNIDYHSWRRGYNGGPQSGTPSEGISVTLVHCTNDASCEGCQQWSQTRNMDVCNV
jgi:hypothetical protein